MTVIHTLSAANFADNLMPVLANDALATVGTRLLFDFGNPKCWPGGNPEQTSKVANLVNVPAVSGSFQALRPTFASDALVFSGDNAGAMKIDKAGATGLPFFPSGDGAFQDTLMICWFKPAARPASNAGVLGIGRSTAGQLGMGLQHHASGNIYEYNTNYLLSIAEPNGVSVQIAVHYAYDVGANTQTIKMYRNGAFVAQVAGSAPASLTQDNNGRAYIGGMAGASNGFNGAIHRVILDHTAEHGLDPALLVARDWADNRARFGL